MFCAIAYHISWSLKTAFSKLNAKYNFKGCYYFWKEKPDVLTMKTNICNLKKKKNEVLNFFFKLSLPPPPPTATA